MKKEDRNTFLLISIILIVCIVSLVAIFNIMWRIISEPVRIAVNEVTYVLNSTRFDDDGDTQVATRVVNYNFEVPDAPEPEIDEVERSTYRDVVNILLAEAQRRNGGTPDENRVAEEIEDEEENVDVKEETEQELNIDNNIVASDEKDDELIEQALAQEFQDSLRPADTQVYDYNFSVPDRNLPQVNLAEVRALPDAIVQDAALAGYGQGESADTQVDLQIRVPKIGINSPVLQGLGSSDLLERGFWVHPGSYELGEGEVIMLCHRRYFGPYDPRSCWFLDEMEVGDEIFMDFADVTLEYHVVGVNVFDGENPLIYTFAEDRDVIKLVTCTPLYSNEERLVVLAERVR